MRLQHLDGIRFFLFTGIFIAHISPVLYGQLGYSLPMFFILSGYLVSYVLSGVFAKNSLKQVVTFYLRRALRTLPCYFLFVGVLIAMGLTSYPMELLTLWYNTKIFLLSIYEPAAYESLSFNFRSESISLWSICVEEQFYLVMPILYFYVNRTKHILLTWSVLAMSFLLKCFFILKYPHVAYGTLLPIALEPIGWGFQFYLLEREGYLKKINPDFASYILLVLLFALPIAEKAMGLDSIHYQFTPTLLHSVFCVLGAAFVWSLWRASTNNWIVRGLSFKPCVYLGQISYGLYLTHLFAWPLYDKLLKNNLLNFPHEPSLLKYGLTIMMGMVLWHFVDAPIMKIREKFRYESAK